MSQIESAVKSFILERFLPGEDPSLLLSDTPLISGGVLDSLATLELVSFLEQTYGSELEAHEVDPDRLDTLARIATLVQSKGGAPA